MKYYYAYIIQHNKKHDYNLMKSEFKLVFNDNQYCPYVTSAFYGNKTRCSWYKFLENINSDFENKG